MPSQRPRRPRTSEPSRHGGRDRCGRPHRSAIRTSSRATCCGVIEDGGKFMAGDDGALPTAGRAIHAAAEIDGGDQAPDRARHRPGWPIRASSPRRRANSYPSYMELWNNTLRRMMGETVDPVAKPETRRHPLQGPGVVGQPLFRLLEAGLSAHHAVGREDARRDARSRRAHARTRPNSYCGRSRARCRRRTSRSPIRKWCARRSRPTARNLVEGMQQLARRRGAIRRPAEDQPDRHQRLRGRPQPRGHARQGGLPERPDPAHPVHADDREGARRCRC